MYSQYRFAPVVAWYWHSIPLKYRYKRSVNTPKCIKHRHFWRYFTSTYFSLSFRIFHPQYPDVEFSLFWTKRREWVSRTRASSSIGLRYMSRNGWKADTSPVAFIHNNPIWMPEQWTEMQHDVLLPSFLHDPLHSTLHNMCKRNNYIEEVRNKLLNVTDRPQSSTQEKQKINQFHTVQIKYYTLIRLR